MDETAKQKHKLKDDLVGGLTAMAVGCGSFLFLTGHVRLVVTASIILASGLMVFLLIAALRPHAIKAAGPSASRETAPRRMPPRRQPSAAEVAAAPHSVWTLFRDPGTVGQAADLRPQVWSLHVMRRMEWRRFEVLCVEFWKLKGYRAQLASVGADEGIDVKIFDSSDPLQLFAIAQCKAGPVGVDVANELWGVLQNIGARRAILYSINGFTTEAMNFAVDKQLDLVSGTELLQQIWQLPVDKAETLLESVTGGDYTTPTCPSCEVKMIERQHGGDSQPGSVFWGCPNFPKCWQTLRVKPYAAPGSL